MKRLTFVLGLLAVLLSTAFGQEYFMQAKVPFEFAAGDKAFPAGNYDFRTSDNFINVKNLDTGKTVPIRFLTRIATDKTVSGKTRISFDVQEGKHFVEAFWPEKGDGYLIHTVKGEHTHAIVRSE